MKSTDYFRTVVPQKHPEVRLEWIQRVLANPVKQTTQEDGRIVYWGNIAEKEGRALRVVTLEDGGTVHNAFFDRSFYRRQLRGEEPQ
ncbi:MAG: hypothetical protein IGR92_08970 [Leptolyngbyaceae cyanobacterium T60_A2020_046]|nr:hypothetical protein [Leptolyngbyaceae cyanobacterium T60_A2020_046]